MAEYIEREAFKAEILRLSTHYLNEWDTLGVLAAADRIPAADVREVVRGKWHSRFYYRESTKSYDCEMHVCSECGSEWSYDAETGSSDFNFCPNCGADMRPQPPKEET